jgi:hypothetical protein
MKLQIIYFVAFLFYFNSCSKLSTNKVIEIKPLYPNLGIEVDDIVENTNYERRSDFTFGEFYEFVFQDSIIQGFELNIEPRYVISQYWVYLFDSLNSKSEIIIEQIISENHGLIECRSDLKNKFIISNYETRRLFTSQYGILEDEYLNKTAYFIIKYEFPRNEDLDFSEPVSTDHFESADGW